VLSEPIRFWGSQPCSVFQVGDIDNGGAMVLAPSICLDAASEIPETGSYGLPVREILFRVPEVGPLTEIARGD